MTPAEKDPGAVPSVEPFDLEKRLEGARERFEARQAKLPPEKRRTWEQACAAEHDDLAHALRKAGKDGGL